MRCSVHDAGAEVAADDVGRDDRDALLADAADLGRAARERDVGDRGQRHRPLAAGIDDQRRISSIDAERVSTLRTSTSIFLSRSR